MLKMTRTTFTYQRDTSTILEALMGVCRFNLTDTVTSSYKDVAILFYIFFRCRNTVSLRVIFRLTQRTCRLILQAHHNK